MPDRAQGQQLEALGLHIAGGEIEQLGRVARRPARRGEIAEVGVNLGGRRVIIARAEMAVGAHHRRPRGG